MPEQPTCEELGKRIQESGQSESERTRAGTALRESEGKYRFMMESMKDST